MLRSFVFRFKQMLLSGPEVLCVWDKIGTCMFFVVTARGAKDRPNNAEDLLPWMIWRMDPAQLKRRWLEDYFYWDGVFSKLCSIRRGS